LLAVGLAAADVLESAGCRTTSEALVSPLFSFIFLFFWQDAFNISRVTEKTLLK
jgi:hypothetical protein